MLVAQSKWTHNHIRRLSLMDVGCNVNAASLCLPPQAQLQFQQGKMHWMFKATITFIFSQNVWPVFDYGFGSKMKVYFPCHSRFWPKMQNPFTISLYMNMKHVRFIALVRWLHLTEAIASNEAVSCHCEWIFLIEWIGRGIWPNIIRNLGFALFYVC